MLPKVLVTQLCPTFCDPMVYSPPGVSVCGILQVRILEWIVIPFSRESSQPPSTSQGKVKETLRSWQYPALAKGPKFRIRLCSNLRPSTLMWKRELKESLSTATDVPSGQEDYVDKSVSSEERYQESYTLRGKQASLNWASQQTTNNSK